MNESILKKEKDIKEKIKKQKQEIIERHGEEFYNNLNETSKKIVSNIRKIKDEE
jgi:predicted GIY-YIG superfamily endonuclease